MTTFIIWCVTTTAIVVIHSYNQHRRYVNHYDLKISEQTRYCQEKINEVIISKQSTDKVCHKQKLVILSLQSKLQKTKKDNIKLKEKINKILG